MLPLKAPRLAADLTIAPVVVASLPFIAAIVFALSVTSLTVDIALSFAILGMALSIQFFCAMRGRSASPADASVFVFGLMFLLVAPIVQISVLGFKLVNTAYARPDLIIATNLSCSVFIGAYLITRAIGSRQPAGPQAAPKPAGLSNLFTLSAMLCLCGFITLFSLPFIGAGTEDRSLTPILLAFRRFVFFIPTAMFLILLVDYVSPGSKRSFLHTALMACLFACVILTENPGTEKRNALGPVYLAILFIVFRPWLMRRAIQVFWLIFVLLVLFPFSALFTQIRFRYLTEDHFSWSVVSDHFLTTHYDAWANIYAAVEMVGRNGISNGKQLLGALVFYVPSNWWPGKPLATGIEIGNYLMTFHSMWFTNLSAPLIAEALIDFSYAGVVLYGIALALIVKAIEGLSTGEKPALAQAFAIYMAFFLVFLLRGSLMIAFAFGSGAIAAFLFSQTLLSLFTALAVKKPRVRLGVHTLDGGTDAPLAAR